jgi:hypothetical protein
LASNVGNTFKYSSGDWMLGLYGSFGSDVKARNAFSRSDLYRLNGTLESLSGRGASFVQRIVDVLL